MNTPMNDRWTDRLSDVLDGDLTAAERTEFEAHLATCAQCAEDLHALRLVTERAGRLEDPPIGHDFWPGIEARVARGVPRTILRLPRPFVFTLPQALAAGLALALISGGSVWWVMQHSRVAAPGSASMPGPLAISRSRDSASSAPGTLLPYGGKVAGGAGDSRDASARYAAYEAHYDQAIAELEQTLANNRTDLDTSTVRIVEQNLAIIDRAIIQARRALEADPASPYLHQHLALQMKLKLDLLRRAATYSDGQG